MRGGEKRVLFDLNFYFKLSRFSCFTIARKGVKMFILSLQKIKSSKCSKPLICFIMIIFFTLGCASKTLIRSRPEGAQVYIDNVRKGVTPLEYSDTAIAGSTKRLRLKKEGYRDFDTVLRKSEFQVGPCIGGVLVLFPFIWVLGYPDEQEFELEKLEEKQSMLHLLYPGFELSL